MQKRRRQRGSICSKPSAVTGPRLAARLPRPGAGEGAASSPSDKVGSWGHSSHPGPSVGSTRMALPGAPCPPSCGGQGKVGKEAEKNHKNDSRPGKNALQPEPKIAPSMQAVEAATRCCDGSSTNTPTRTPGLGGGSAPAERVRGCTVSMAKRGQAPNHLPEDWAGWSPGPSLQEASGCALQKALPAVLGYSGTGGEGSVVLLPSHGTAKASLFHPGVAFVTLPFRNSVW